MSIRALQATRACLTQKAASYTKVADNMRNFSIENELISATLKSCTTKQKVFSANMSQHLIEELTGYSPCSSIKKTGLGNKFALWNRGALSEHCFGQSWL